MYEGNAKFLILEAYSKHSHMIFWHLYWTSEGWSQGYSLRDRIDCHVHEGLPAHGFLRQHILFLHWMGQLFVTDENLDEIWFLLDKWDLHAIRIKPRTNFVLDSNLLIEYKMSYIAQITTQKLNPIRLGGPKSTHLAWAGGQFYPPP